MFALYKSYWAAMNKIFIYALACVNKMTCSAAFFVSFPKYPTIDGNDENRSRIVLELSFVLATQANSKSGEDVSQKNTAWMIRWKVCRKEWHLRWPEPIYMRVGYVFDLRFSEWKIQPISKIFGILNK